MPDQSQTSPAAFNCEGGLVLNKSTFLMEPGEALELRNFEPDIEGGYRRINGFSKYVSAVVPFTSTSSEKVLMVASFADVVLAARGTSIYSATPGGSSWTSRDSGRTSAGKYSFERFNFDGTDKIVVVDYKTTQSVEPYAFANSVKKFRYDLQASWYRRGMEAAGYEVEEFMFVAQEKTYPYASKVFRMTKEQMDFGWAIMETYLDNYKEYEKGKPISTYNSPNIVDLEL